jgi:hypothetical protein
LEYQKNKKLNKNILDKLLLLLWLVGKPARSCKDFINQLKDNITFKAYYPQNDYERNYKG